VAAALVARGLLLRAAIAGRLEGCFTPDSVAYASLATGLLEEGRFARWSMRDGASPPEVFRTPGYPLLLAANLWADRSEGVWQTVLATQVLLDGLLVLVTYWLGCLVASRPAAVVAAALLALSPLSAAASCRVLSDSLYAFLLTVATLLMVGHLRTGLWWALLVSAGVLAAGCYVRPVGLVMAGVFALVLLARPRRLARAGAFVGVVLAGIAPWVVRNGVAGGYWGFSSFAADSLYYHSAAEVVAATEGIDAETGRYRMREEARAMAADPSQPTVGQLVRRRAARAWEVLLAHPGTYARIHLEGCVAFWLPGATDALEVAGLARPGRGTLDVLHERGLAEAARHYFGGSAAAVALAAPMVAVLLVQYAGVVACAASRRRRMPAAAWLMLLAVAVSAMLGGPAATPRFRVPVNPMLCVAAGVGLVAAWGRLRRGRARAGGKA